MRESDWLYSLQIRWFDMSTKRFQTIGVKCGRLEAIDQTKISNQFLCPYYYALVSCSLFFGPASTPSPYMYRVSQDYAVVFLTAIIIK